MENNMKEFLGKFVKKPKETNYAFICGEHKEYFLAVVLNDSSEILRSLYFYKENIKDNYLIINPPPEAEPEALLAYIHRSVAVGNMKGELITMESLEQESENMLGKFFQHNNQSRLFFVCGENKKTNHWISIHIEDDQPRDLYITDKSDPYNIRKIDMDTIPLIKYARKHYKTKGEAIAQATIMPLPEEDSNNRNIQKPISKRGQEPTTEETKEKEMTTKLEKTVHRIKDVSLHSAKEAAQLELVGRTGLKLAKQQICGMVPQIPEEIQDNPLFDIVIATLVSACAGTFSPDNRHANILAHTMSTVAFQNGIQKFDIPGLVTGLVSKVGEGQLQALLEEE
jgi:hypothetical protein